MKQERGDPFNISPRIAFKNINDIQDLFYNNNYELDIDFLNDNSFSHAVNRISNRMQGFMTGRIKIPKKLDTFIEA